MNNLRKFEKEFPKAAREVGYSPAINISFRCKAFWLNNEVQLTGYEVGENGGHASKADNEAIAIKRIKEFKEGLSTLEKESLVTRFIRLIDGVEPLKPKWKHSTTYRREGGDKATIMDDGDLWITFTGIDYQFKATGKKTRQEAIVECVRQFEAYTGAKIGGVI